MLHVQIPQDKGIISCPTETEFVFLLIVMCVIVIFFLILDSFGMDLAINEIVYNLCNCDLKKLGCPANYILLPLIRHSFGDLRKLWKIDYYFKMKLVLELLESQGENERIATYHGLFERLDGLPLPPLLVPG